MKSTSSSMDPIVGILSTNTRKVKHLNFSGSSTELVSNHNVCAVNINLSDFFHEQNSELLLNALMKNRTIECINFYYVICLSDYKENFQDLLKTLIKTIFQLPGLKQVHFKFHSSSNAIDYSQIICSAICNSSNASITKLSFERCYLHTLIENNGTYEDDNSIINKGNYSNKNNMHQLQEFWDSIVDNFPSLKHVSIREDDLATGGGCKMLYEALLNKEKPCSIEILEFIKCEIGDKCCQELAKLLRDDDKKHKPIKELILRNNLISDDGLQVMINKGLDGNLTLKHLDVGLNLITKKGWKFMLDALQNNKLIGLESINHNLHNKSPSHCPKDMYERIQFYLKLNKAGRRYFISAGYDRREIVITNTQWINSLINITNDTPCLYYFINNNPDQCNFDCNSAL